MSISRRNFLGLASVAGLAGCARIEQSRLGQLAPEFSFHGDGISKFAAMGDFHLHRARDIGLVGRAVNRINNDPEIDFVAVLGDMTAGGTLPEMNLARQALARLEKPYYCVPGEHDINAATENPYEFYTRTFGRTQWRNTSEGWVFIGIDTCDSTGGGAGFPAERLAWLENQLSHTDRKKPVALFSHHPLNPGSGGERLAEADAILALFEAHNLRLAAAAHTHENHVEEVDGVVFTTTAACSGAIADGGGERGYRVFTLTGDSVAHEFVDVT